MASQDAILYREVQYARQWWIALIILATTVLGWWAFVEQIILGRPFGTNPAPDWFVVVIWLLFGIGIPVMWYQVRLVIEVHADQVVIRYVPFLVRRIPLDTIVKVQARSYHPLREFGGWGIRFVLFGNKRAYSVSGNRGVELLLNNERRILIGSEQADQLAQAIEVRLRAR
jgi:hypothetical protein